MAYIFILIEDRVKKKSGAPLAQLPKDKTLSDEKEEQEDSNDDDFG